MTIKKKISDNTVVSAWQYEEADRRGISVGGYNASNGGPAYAFVSVEECNIFGKFEKRVVIDKAELEKYGFTLVAE